MRNTLCSTPSTVTATAATALSLLQAPALVEARGADVIPPPTNAPLSQVERALVQGNAADAVKTIDSSALKEVRPEVVEKDLPRVVANVIKELMERGQTEAAQRVYRSMYLFAPESARRGALQAFAELDTAMFEKFCDQSILHGSKPYVGLREELASPGRSISTDPSTSAGMIEVMERADTARTKTQIGVDVGAVCASGIAAAGGAASNRAFLYRAAQTIGGMIAFAASTVVSWSTLGTNSGFWSVDSLIFVVSTIIGGYSFDHILKGLGLGRAD